MHAARVHKAAFSGINAAVVGLLIAALYHPLWTSAIHSSADLALGQVGFGLLMFWRWPPRIVVLLSAAVGEMIARSLPQ